MFSLVENLPKLEFYDINKLVTLTENLLLKYNQFTNCSYVVQEVFLKCITCLWLQLDELRYDCVENLYILTLESITKLDECNAIGRSKYLESASLFLFSISIKAKTDFSAIVSTILKTKIHCKTAFGILSIILSENSVELCDNLEKLKSLKYWNRKFLLDQLMANKSLMELICQQCTIIDSLSDIKYLVLSNFIPALHMYFKMYESIDHFISKVFTFRRDTEIAHALLCINGYICELVSGKIILINIQSK